MKTLKMDMYMGAFGIGLSFQLYPLLALVTEEVSKFMGKTFQAAQLTHESFDH